MEELRYSSTILARSMPLTLYLRGQSPGTHYIGGIVGPRTGQDAVEYRKTFFRYRTPITRQSVSIPTELSRLHFEDTD
jgi:hypothetical protein